MFITIINKILFFKDHLSPKKTSVSMVHIRVLKLGLGQIDMYNYQYKNKTTDIYRYPEVTSILKSGVTLQNYISIMERNLSQICSLYTFYTCTFTIKHHLGFCNIFLFFKHLVNIKLDILSAFPWSYIMC